MVRSKVLTWGHSRREVQEKASTIDCLMDLTITRLLEGAESTMRTEGVCHKLKARRWRGECKRCFQGLLMTGNGELGKSAMAMLVKGNLPSVHEFTVG